MFIKDFLIEDRIDVYIELGMIDIHPRGITVTDCVDVKLSADISPELIQA